MKNPQHSHNMQLRDRLFRLVETDTLAVAVYEQAILRTADDDLRTTLHDFQAQHLQHVRELPAAIQHFGWATPEFKLDTRDHLAEWVTGVRCGHSDERVLRTLHVAERRHADAYGQAVEWDIDDAQLLELLIAFREHETAHLVYVEETLASSVASPQE